MLLRNAAAARRYVEVQTVFAKIPSSESDRHRVLLAALPPLLYGLGITLKALIIGAPWYTVPAWRLVAGIAAELLAATVLVVGGLVALARRLPDWGYTWSGAGLMTLALGLQVLAEERAETGQSIVSPAADLAMGALIVLAGVLVLLIVARRGWPQAGLASIGLSTTLALSACSSATNAPFHRYDLALVAGPLGLIAAALTYGYICGAGPIRVVAIVAIGMANAGAAWIVNQAWQAWLVARGRPSVLVPLLVLLAGSLLTGPLLGLFVLPLRRVLKRA